VVAVALAVGGLAWIVALSTLNSLYQLSLPQRVKARGMSFYLVVFQGGSAFGSVAFGVAAQHIGQPAPHRGKFLASLAGQYRAKPGPGAVRCRLLG
jgi:Transmembrane secretion effector